MKSFLLIQLVFNILILVGLITLAVGGRSRRGRRQRREPANAPDTGNRATGSGPAKSGEAQVPATAHAGSKLRGLSRPAQGNRESGLDDLIDRAEREELVAEGALKRRLERLRTQAVG